MGSTIKDSFFVVRAKTNIKSRVLRWKRRLLKNILSDCEIELTGNYSQKAYPERIRMVRYWDEDDQLEFIYFYKCKADFCATSCRIVQESLAGEAVFQMAQAAPKNQEILGNF